MGIADFVIKLVLDSSGVAKGSDKAKTEISGLASKLDGMFSKFGNIGQKFSGFFSAIGGLRGGALIGVLTGLFAQIEQRFDAMMEKARNIRIGEARTGLDSGDFQRGSNVFESKGSSAEAFEHSLEKTADAIQTIRDGQDEGAKLQMSFARLGVTLDDIKKKNHAQVFFEIAENMKGMEVSAERLSALKNIFGKNAGELIPAFKEGLDGNVANRGLLDEDQIKAAEAALAEQKKLEAAGNDMLSTPLGAPLARGTSLLKHPLGALLEFGQFVKKHPLMAALSPAMFLDKNVAESDESAFSTPGQEESQKALKEQEVAAQIKKGKADAADAAKKREQDKARDLSLKNATKLSDMRISALGTGAQEAALKKHSQELVDEIRGTAPGEDREKLRAELLENEQKLASIKPDLKGYSLARPSDSLSKIGLFRGDAESSSQRIWTEQLSVQRLALSEQRRTVQRLDQLRNDLTSLD